MSQTRTYATVYLTLADNLHDFDTLEVQLDPTANVSLTDHFENPEEKFRHEILNELRDTSMWKATLNNPDGAPYKVRIGTVVINLETDSLDSLDLDKTSHHSVNAHELTPRDE